MSASDQIEVIAQVTVRYSTDTQRESVLAKIPAGVAVVVDAVLKQVRFTVTQVVDSI